MDHYRGGQICYDSLASARVLAQRELRKSRHERTNKKVKAHSQGNNDPGTNDRSPSTLIPIEAEGFHAFADAFALDGQWVIFLSIAGHKDAVKAIRATLLTDHWINVGGDESCLLPRTKYGTIVRTLPCGITHIAIFIKNNLPQSHVHYPLTASPVTSDSDLYFTALIRHSAVPVHTEWKAWLHKRAVKKKEVETLTAHGIHGLKVSLDDGGLAEDISAALKKGKLKRVLNKASLLPA
ncbi:MAG TPA: hypothetical protein VFM35_12115 [Candidatus Binatia bacterium]|nr:hypothetical protein [Candidatus Binatia bacterium]